MTIRFKCDSCGVAMKIKDELAGKKGKCPKCKSTFVIPELEEEVVEEDEEIEEEEEEWDDEEEDDDDDLLDMPLELTSAPVTAPPTAASRSEAAPRDRKAASQSRKAVQISSKKKSADDGGFDPTDVLFGDDDGDSSDSSGSLGGRVAAGLDAGDDGEDTGDGRSSTMSEMFKDFVPAGGHKKDAPSVDSTSVAAQALARKAEEKRNKSNAPPPVEEEEGTDYVGALKDVWDQYKLIVIGFSVVMLGALYMGGWFSSGDVPDLYDVEGIVTRQGAPVGGATLTFTPQVDPNAKLSNNSGGMAMTGADGSYTAQYSADNDGIPPGKYVVDVTENGRMVGQWKVEIKEQYNQLDLEF